MLTLETVRNVYDLVGVGELALDRAIRAALARGASVVVVAHRPSALNAIHDLLVLAGGQVAAYGKRDDVLKKVGAARPTQDPPSALTQQAATPTLSLGGKITMPSPQTRN